MQPVIDLASSFLQEDHMWKPFNALLGLLALLVPWCASVEASEKPLDFEIQASNLNVRGQPSSSGIQVDRLGKGTRVTVYQRRGSWARISPDSNRWVHSGYLVRNLSGGLAYSVIDSDMIPGAKLSLDVRLSRKATEKELAQIARELKVGTQGSYSRAFILHYLPGMKPGAGAWATTHFNPSLQVKILGMTTEQEQALAGQVSSPGQQVIGVWLDETPYTANRTTLYKKGGKIFRERKFKDGSELTEEMIERSSSSGRRFDMRDRNTAGDYIVIRASGVLELRDSIGLISTARPVK
jgi:hypothetical protein